jgi:hypothetical protein
MEKQEINTNLVSRCHIYENAADDFFVSLLAGYEEFREIYTKLVWIINGAKLAAICPNEPVGYHCDAELPGTGTPLGPGIMTAPVTATHPAMIIRVLDLLDKTWKAKPEEGGLQGGFHIQIREIRKRSVQLRNLAYTGGVCEIKN